MEKDEVLSREVKQEWLKQYHNSMTASFRTSEALLEHYAAKNLEEFKRELKEAKDRV